MANSWYSKKWMTVLVHAAAWMLLFSLPFLLHTSHNPSEMKPGPINSHFIFMMQVVSDAILIIIFYLNAIILIPRFLYKRKYAWYTLSLIICLAIFVLAIWELWVNFSDRIEFSFEAHLLISSFIFIFIIACSSAYKMIRDRIIADQLAKEKETEHLKTKLSLLRSQASPHFMFNVLNNMVALARKHSDDLEPSIIKFSSLMRYMLYGNDEEKVSLESEVEYLQSYVDLQQQRLSKKMSVVVNICKADKPYEIDPMLLIPFVENAFKHGTGFIENPHIEIELKAKDNVLYFHVSNTFDPASQQVKDKAEFSIMRRLFQIKLIQPFFLKIKTCKKVRWLYFLILLLIYFIQVLIK